jgi:hypothetical protein
MIVKYHYKIIVQAVCLYFYRNDRFKK